MNFVIIKVIDGNVPNLSWFIDYSEQLGSVKIILGWMYDETESDINCHVNL